MIPFQENSWIETAMEGWTHTFIGSFLLPPGVQQVFKSQKYRARCRSNQKLLHHSQYANNQLNS